MSLLRRLEYEELKYRLLAFLVVAEAKLKIVQVKYGNQDEVFAMLQDYIVSVILFSKFKALYVLLLRGVTSFQSLHYSLEGQNFLLAMWMNFNISHLK